MNPILLGSFGGTVLGLLMAFLSVFLIMLVLIQRGKGGGLTGALGGPGGQSAFGSKAGDTFTVITVVVASIWGFTCAFTMWLLGTHSAPVADTNIKAGPGDADPGPTSMPLDLPSGDGFGIGGGFDPGAASSPSGTTSSDQGGIELTPRDSQASEPEATDEAEAGQSASEPDSGDTESANAEEPAADDSDSPTGEAADGSQGESTDEADSSDDNDN